MPRDTIRALLEVVLGRRVGGGAVHEVDSGEPFWRAAGRVDVRRTEVFGELERVFDGQVGKVLVPEGYDFLLRDEEGEFVTACAVEGAQLDAFDFGADVGAEVFDLGIGEEVGKGWVGVFAVFVGLEGLEGWVFHVVPEREVVGVFGWGVFARAFQFGFVVGAAWTLGKGFFVAILTLVFGVNGLCLLGRDRGKLRDVNQCWCHDCSFWECVDCRV